MADRVSASITIGGQLPSILIADLINAINGEGLSLEYDGGPIAADELISGEPLKLYANEVAWGCFNALEGFCQEHGLAYRRWHGAYAGSWGSGRSVYRGGNVSIGLAVVTDHAASEDGEVLIDAETVRRLGSFEAILAYFADADFEILPLELIDATASPQTAAIAVPA